MSLFGSIQLANNTLRANQIGLQVTGQNIANANTPGYIREEAVFSAAPTQRLGRVLLGLGVEVEAVIQKVDHYLEQRLRNATSDRSAADIEEQTLLELESIFGELEDTDTSSSLSDFFASIADLSEEPDSLALRRMAVLRGQTLTGDINRLSKQAFEARSALNDRVKNAADDINRLLERIRVLNLRIADAEGSDVSNSDAVGLRDQRHAALADLAKLIDIQVHEQPGGMVSVFCGGEYLVIDGDARLITVDQHSDRGLTVNELRIEITNAPLRYTAGEVAGLVKSRDDVLGGFLDSLDSFATTLAFDFNRIFSTGQGASGYSQVTSLEAVNSTTVSLDAAGLAYTPQNGSFQVQLYNPATGLTETTDIRVDLNGFDTDTTLADLAAAIDAINGVTAVIDSDNHLSITSDSPDQEIAFANDTSGILAALGINTFFTGADARNLGINSYIAADPLKFSTSAGGVGEDAQIALRLALFHDEPLASNGGLNLAEIYEKLSADVTQTSAIARSAAEGARVFENQLKGQSQAITGVSIDDEVLRMIQYQRSFQASAKYIAALDELLQILVSL
jgi:flagellar hook-associated protein 1 FlgK